ncbi:MAG: hypothetical protein ACPL7D_04215 [Candidatus Sumerlaeaceae bacterium]
MLLCAHVFYAVAFILRSSFVVQGERYFCLMDDAMVSMRYARNLALGYGWVWNPGEPPVEGYTNPLWCLVMALVHFAPIPQSKTSLVVQLLGELCLLVNMIIVFAIARRLLLLPFALACTTLVAFYFPLNNWALQGMDVAPLTPLISLTSLSLLRGLESRNFRAVCFAPTSVAMALRPDGVVPHATAAILATRIWPKQRARILLAAVLLFFVVAGGWTVFRRLYYGDWLPNTYYLKMTGFPPLLRATRGAFQAAKFWGILLLPFVGAFVILWRVTLPALRDLWRHHRDQLLIVGAFVVMQTAYSIYVGGDAWEGVTGANRFIAPAMPLAFVLLTALIASTYQRATHRWRSGIVALLVFAFAVWGNCFYGVTSLRQAFLLAPPPYREDNQRNVELARWLAKITTPQARVAIDYAGTAPYFLERNMIDLLGKSDWHVARLPAHRGMLRLPAYREFYPGHLKWDYAYSIGTLQPDVVCAIWRNSLADAPKYLAHTYLQTDFCGVSVYLRKGSSAIRWAAIISPLKEVTAP